MKNTSDKQKAWFGWCMYDWANSGYATVIMAAVFPIYFAAIVPAGGAPISFFGFSRTVPAAALWGYVISISMLAVALTAPYLGNLTDHRGGRRRYLIFFTGIGSIASAALALAGPGDYLMAGVFFIVANFGFALGNIFYDAFLRPWPHARDDLDRLSAQGYAWGYVGGGLAAAARLPPRPVARILRFRRPRQRHPRRVCSSPACGGGSSPCPPSPMPSRRVSFTAPAGTPLRSWRDYLALFAALRRYPDLLLFLLAFLALQRRHPDDHHRGRDLRPQGARSVADHDLCRSF